MKRFIILVVFLTVILVGGYLFLREGSLPVDKTDTTTKIFVIKQGESLDQIANNLSSQGFIRNKLAFYFVVKRLGIDKKIQAGDFRLSPSMNLNDIAQTLTHGTLDKWVTVIEGLRKEEVAQIMSENLGIPEVEFLKYAKEGYLFPDTYLFPNQATAEGVIAIMQNNYNAKFDANLKAKAMKNGLTENEVIILASMVEREARSDADRQKVASIVLKRYRNDWPAQVDATVQYAVGYDANEKSWWKEHLTADDLDIDSPYNTYKNKGLPPTPITNPGLSSIVAVVNADDSIPYWFYISDKNGVMHYAKTVEEHDSLVQKYLR